MSNILNLNELNEEFDFKDITISNPILISGSNYFSKINKGSINKNLYIQFPKCSLKNPLQKNSTKNTCELVFNSNEKKVLEFFENLETFCCQEIYKNKDIWFYEPDEMTIDDIKDILTPIMRSYKSGKNFIVKCIIKNNKLTIYDENEKKIETSDFDYKNELIPLININGIKLTSKNFSIELVLTQFLVIYPSDSFEEQFLIKIENKNKNFPNIDLKNTHDVTSDNLEKLNDNESDNNDIDTNINTDDNKNNSKDELNINNLTEDSNKDNNNEITDQNKNNNLDIDLNLEIEDLSKKEEKDGFNYLTNYSLDDIECKDGELNLDDVKVNESDKLELKTQETIYLEIYKKALQKAKDIRKNAIQAFIEAKNIKNRYNLDYNDENSSDEEDFYNIM